MTSRRILSRPYAIAGAFLLAACTSEFDAHLGTPEEAARGALALHQHGCGTCHRIAGIAGADGVVGPPLVDMARRVYLSRGLPNTRDNMMRWIRTPQQFAPGSAMPDMRVSSADAQAITAYLYQQK